MSRDLIPPDHPYIKQLRPSVWLMGNGKWTVRWRDFLTYKHDAEFATREDARHFARKLILGPHLLPDWVGPREILDADHYWRDLYSI